MSPEVILSRPHEEIGERPNLRRALGMMVVSSFFRADAVSAPPAPVQRSLAYSSNASAVQDEIAARGPRAVVKDLYGHPADWDYAMKQIQSGNDEWLRVAVALRPGSDAGSSEMLGESVGVALIRVPESVLRLTIPAFDVEVVCGGRQDPLPTWVDASAELEAQIASVTQLKSSRVRSMRDRCLAKLKEGRAALI